TATGHPERAARSMASGSVAIGWDLISGKDSSGRKTTDTPQHVDEWLARTWSPFAAETTGKTLVKGAEGIATGDVEKTAEAGAGGVLNVFGIKSADQSYSDVRDEISRNRYGKPYSDLAVGERREVRKAAELLEKQRGF